MYLRGSAALCFTFGISFLTSCAEGSGSPPEPADSTGGASSDGSGGSDTGGSGGAPAGSGGGVGEPYSACPQNSLLCEGFDGGNLDQWTLSESGGSVEINSDISVTGRSSLLVVQPAGQAGGFLEFSGAPLFPLPENKMYGRLMIYFERLPAGHTDIIRGADANAGVPWYNVGHQYGEVLLNYFEEYPGVDCWARPSPGYVLPTEEWMCWEWVFDGPAQQMEFYINGELERTVNTQGDGCVEGGNQAWEAPEFSTLLIGAYNAQRSEMPNEGRLWIDDVAVGVDGRMGCPPL